MKNKLEEIFYKTRLSMKNMFNLDKIIQYRIKYNHLETNAISSNDSLINEDSNAPVISLTTYSHRIKTVHITIESLGEQSVKASEIILWLDEEEFSEETLPGFIKRQMARGLKVKFCKNYRSYKKIIPLLIDGTDKDIITVDDDIIYPPYLVDNFISEAKKSPDKILCNRARKIAVLDGNLLSYSSWEYQKKPAALNNLIPIGVGGVFYPKGSFYKDILREDVFEKLAPNADDLWLKIMTHKNSKHSKLITREEHWNEDFISINRTQNIALNLDNVMNKKNDDQVKNLIEFYKIDPNEFI